MCKQVMIFMMGMYALAAVAGGPAPGEWQEVGDAPSFPDGQAQVTRGQGALNVIRGTTGSNNPRNAYCIKITDPSNFVATTDNAINGAANTDFDTRLFLFDKTGKPLLFNDDTPPSAAPFASTLRSATTDGSNFVLTQNGEYILVVAGFSDDPVDNIANNLFNQQAELIHAPIAGSNKFAAWENSNPATGNYFMALEGVSYCQDQIDIVGTGFTLQNNTQMCSGNNNRLFDGCNNSSIDSSKENITTGYLNNDADLDVVFDGFFGPPTVCLGNGNGGYENCEVLNIGTNDTGEALIADINNDNINDVLFLGVGVNHRVCLGNGSGAFNVCNEVPHTDTSGNGVLALMDGDNLLDLVFTIFSELRVCSGDGQGGFAPCVATIVEVEDIVVADVNNDSLNDVVGATLFGPNQVCINNGSGQLNCSNVSNQNNTTSAVDAADIDGDGNIDAVFANTDVGSPGVNQVCLGDGDGDFSCSDVSGFGGDYDAVKMALINDDNALDVVFAAGEFVRVCFGNGFTSGDGTFIDCFNDNSLDYKDIELGEFGQYQLNEWQEVADAPSYPDGQAQVTRGQGQLDMIRGETTANTDSRDADSRDAYCIKITDPAAFVATTDINSNNSASAAFDTRLFLFDQKGKPLLFNDDTPPSTFPFNSTLTSTATDGSAFVLDKAGEYTLVIAGFSDDPVDNIATNLFEQDTDLVHALLPDSNKFATWENNNPATGEYNVILQGVNYCQNELDLVAIDSELNNQTQLCFGDGQGGFADCNDESTSGNISNISTGFINNDAHLDVVLDHFSSQPTICLGNGIGGYIECSIFDDKVINNSEYSALVDINNDQITDMIFAGPINDFDVCLGNEDENFDCTDWPNNQLVADIEVALMNNDNVLDLVITRFSSGIDVCLGDGLGGFDDCVRTASVNAEEMVVVDVNNDGVNDLFLNEDGGTKKVCINDGTGALMCNDMDTEISRNSRVASGDFNNDCFVDAIFSEVTGTNPGVNKICINDSMGGFTCNPVSNVMGSYIDATVGLLNDDNHLDVAFTFSSETVGIRTCLGNGDGTFSSCTNDSNLMFSRIVLGEFGEPIINEDEIIFANGFE